MRRGMVSPSRAQSWSGPRLELFTPLSTTSPNAGEVQEHHHLDGGRSPNSGLRYAP